MAVAACGQQNTALIGSSGCIARIVVQTATASARSTDASTTATLAAARRSEAARTARTSKGTSATDTELAYERAISAKNAPTVGRPVTTTTVKPLDRDGSSDGGRLRFRTLVSFRVGRMR